MYINRILDIDLLLKDKSMFLFGPRQTGKSTLIRNSGVESVLTFNLLDQALYFELTSEPAVFRQQILHAAKSKKTSLVIVDEIQRLPGLLNEIQLLIEEHGIKFLLTGSSPRKLRRAGVNLLGGRARQQFLHPLTYRELGPDRFDLMRALNRGLIPSHYFSLQPRLDLRTYAGVYLETEIANEAFVRNIESFSRFLLIAAMSNGQIINQSTIASDAKVPRKVVAEYIGILKDTLIAYELEAWSKSTKRKALESSKLYFFDVGVARAIRDLPAVKEKSPDFGDAFEQYIFHELRTYVDYVSPWTSLNYWRSTSGFEVDFILGDEVAIEVKGKKSVSEKDLRGLRALAEEGDFRHKIVVCLEPKPRETDDGIEILPWQNFLESLWASKYLRDDSDF